MMKIMEKAEVFRNDSEVIEMYDRDTTINCIHELDKKDAVDETIRETTEKVTKEVTSSITNSIAINLLKIDMSTADICKVTGLSIEEINKLKDDLN